MPEEPKEIERGSTASKKIYYYVDKEKGIDQLSREVYPRKNIEIHYPRGFDGGEKYVTFKKFHYEGFNGKLPTGVVKALSFGWGFTKALNPFTYFLEDNYNFEAVIIKKGGKVDFDIDAKKLYLNEIALDTLVKEFNAIYAKNRDETKFVLHSTLFTLFPNHIEEPQRTYRANALAMSLAAWGNGIDEFSEKDKNAIKDLFEKLSVSTDFLTSTALAKTKEIIDSKYIQATLKEYKELIKLKTDGENLEKQWQQFLADNSWIFSYVFAQPIILHQREAYAGGKGIDNTNGKFTDFLIKNNLSDNVSFLEIKTHKTRLVDNSAYRGSDVYSASKDLTSCVVQVLNQRDNFQKEFYATKVKSKKAGNIETFNSKCVVLIGSIGDLNDEQKYSFELFRSNSRDVEIVTFDELQVKIEALQRLINKK